MKYTFNSDELRKTFQSADWYLKLESLISDMFIANNQYPNRDAPKDWLEFRAKFMALVSECLSLGEIALGNEGQDFDKKRQLIDTIVVHHTSNPPDFGSDQLNAMGLLRVYVKHYLDRKSVDYGKPIWSNHIVSGQQVFVPYHYLISQHGQVIKALPSNCVGWHCGDSDWNARSIAICFLDDLETKEPTKLALAAARAIIEKYKPKYVLGHREIKTTTNCPGGRFLGQDGWKQKLLLQ